ncbi:MAG TPA: hypothetical protein VGH19_09330 [Verrucomicrobiae bacterium]
MNYRIIYIGSLLLNALLVLGLLYQHFNGQRKQITTTSVSASPVKGLKTAEPAPPKVIDVEGETFTWDEMNVADYHAYVKNLRTLGCPEITVQDIIYALVDKDYAHKVRALNQRLRIGRDGLSFDYWTSFGANREAVVERIRKQMQLNQERDALLFALLGVDVDKERQIRHGIMDKNPSQLAFLTPLQSRQVAMVTSSYMQLEGTIGMKYHRYSGEEPFAEKAAFAKERDAELLKIMSASQLEEYKLQRSPVAQRLRHDLGASGVSDLEFRALYKIDEKYDRSNQPPLDWDDPAVMKKLIEMSARKEEEMRLVITDPKKRERVIDALQSRRGKDF